MNRRPSDDWWVLPLLAIVCAVFPPLYIVVLIVVLCKK